jgi:hypothetical protein
MNQFLKLGANAQHCLVIGPEMERREILREYSMTP